MRIRDLKIFSGALRPQTTRREEESHFQNFGKFPHPKKTFWFGFLPMG
jgi:hypothetical protein